MGFKRPQVRLLSLGPRKRDILWDISFFAFTAFFAENHRNLRPLVYCIFGHRPQARECVAAAGSTPVTRTTQKRYPLGYLFFLRLLPFLLKITGTCGLWLSNRKEGRSCNIFAWTTNAREAVIRNFTGRNGRHLPKIYLMKLTAGQRAFL